MSKGKVIVTELEDCLHILSPYSEKFTQSLRDIVPYSSRKWLPDAKVWEVDIVFAPEVDSIISEAYPGVEIVWT